MFKNRPTAYAREFTVRVPFSLILSSQLSQHITEDAGFLCYKTVVLGGAVKEITPIYSMVLHMYRIF